MTPRQVTAATLLVNDHRIPLSVHTDVPSLIDDVTSAVDSGGAFVHVEGRLGRTYDVLINPATQVLVCRELVFLEPEALDAPWDLRVDLEY